MLDYFSRDVELGLGAQVWLVRGGTAQAAIQAGGETGVDSRLSTLQTDSEMGAAGITRTAGEVFSSLLEQGCAYLPALRAAGPEEGEGQTVLLEAGYGVLRDGKLAGYLERGERQGAGAAHRPDGGGYYRGGPALGAGGGPDHGGLDAVRAGLSGGGADRPAPLLPGGRRAGRVP